MKMRRILPDEIATKDLHQYVVGSITPRPIAFVSTIDEKGVRNLAPYSFFNAFSSNPPILIFSSNRRVTNNTTKDTLHNVRVTGEVVVNVVTYSMVRQTAVASIEFPSEVSEFDKTGFTPVESEFVKPCRVAESPIHMECRVEDIITLGEHGGAGHLIICRIICMHISEDVISDQDRIDPVKLDVVGRLGRAYYTRVNAESIMTIVQSVTQLSIGYDQLPETIRQSNILTGNDIGLLAGLYEIPAVDDSLAWVNQDEKAKRLLAESLDMTAIHEYAHALLDQMKCEEALKLLVVADQQSRI